jgi:hypothetical protein
MASPSIWLNKNDVLNAVSSATTVADAIAAVNNCCPTRMISIDPGPPVTATVTTYEGGNPVSVTLPL